MVYNNTAKSAKFWEFEEPQVIQTEKNTIRYYEQAQRIVFHMPDFIGKDGKMRLGKGVGLQMNEMTIEQLEQLIGFLQNQIKILKS